MRKCRYGLLLALCGAVMITSCRTIQYVPLETNTQVNIKDSTIYNYIDSIRIHEATRYKEMGWLTDTARIKSSRGNIAWAVADTAGERLTLGLEEAPFEEKTRIIYKDRWKVRDSLVYVEKPVPVDRVEYKTPTWSWYSLILNVIGLLVIGFSIYLRIKKR